MVVDVGVEVGVDVSVDVGVGMCAGVGVVGTCCFKWKSVALINTSICRLRSSRLLSREEIICSTTGRDIPSEGADALFGCPSASCAPCGSTLDCVDTCHETILFHPPKLLHLILHDAVNDQACCLSVLPHLFTLANQPALQQIRSPYKTMPLYYKRKMTTPDAR